MSDLRLCAAAVLRILRSQRRLPRRGPLALALSMGADSLALLGALRLLHARGRIAEPTMVHVDHGQRADSAATAAAARGLCARLGLPLVVKTPPLPRGVGELALREARYAAFADAAAERGLGALLLAHHADDQLETVAMRVLRGSSTRGLAGMPSVRPLAGSCVLLRPLLGLRRATLRGALAEAGLTAAVCEDPSNLDLRFLRNRLRHVAFPAWRAARGTGFDARLLARAALRRAEAETREAEARGWLARFARVAPGFRAELVFAGTEPVAWPAPRHLTEILRLACLAVSGTAPLRTWLRRALRLLSQPSGTLLLAGSDCAVERTRAGLLMVAAATLDSPPAASDLPLDGRAQPFGATGFWVAATARCGPWQPRAEPDRGQGSVDLATLALPLVLRAPVRGDRFEQAGQVRPILLREHLQRRQVPRLDRPRLPLLVDARGRIVWARGLDVAAFARVRSAGRSRLARLDFDSGIGGTAAGSAPVGPPY
ncbi:MAG: tRNA lysidine(34) synthetase TilS [Planctomycetes bacterium]|nr:tRNA lysidine(34) synthetase TilS [Planctomycetota bacterium]